LAHDDGVSAIVHGSQVDHGGGFKWAGTCIDHRGHLMLELASDLFGIVQWFGLATRNQCGCQKWRAVQFEQGLQGFVVRYTQTDGLAGRVAEPARNFFAGFQNEGVRAGCGRFEKPKLLVVDACVIRQFAEVAVRWCLSSTPRMRRRLSAAALSSKWQTSA
jgi:hypothetical protein